MPETLPPPEFKEGEKEKSNLTVFLLRHGESSNDKTDPNRPLTEAGQAQVKEAFAKILDQILAEENPEFNKWDNEEAKKEALTQALQNVEIHLRDSGTYRTKQQEWIEAEMLTDLGIDINEVNLPKSAYEWKGQDAPETAGPGVKRRLTGIGGMEKNPKFRKKIRDPEYLKKMGTTDELIAWALTPEDEIPEGVENKNRVTQRYKKDLAVVAKKAKTLDNYPKRPVVIANSHASIITVAAAKEFDIPIEELGQIENAEGLRFDFYGGDKTYDVKPFGEKTEKKVEGLTRQD